MVHFPSLSPNSTHFANPQLHPCPCREIGSKQPLKILHWFWIINSPPSLKAILHSWQRIPNPLFYEDPPILPTPPVFQISSILPCSCCCLVYFLDWMVDCATSDQSFFIQWPCGFTPVEYVPHVPVSTTLVCFKDIAVCFMQSIRRRFTEV